MATHKARTPVELARYFFVLTTFGVVAWMALAFAVLQTPDDPGGVQERDAANSVWLSQHGPPPVAGGPRTQVAQR